MTPRAIKNQGMNWISQKRRLAIYMRDGLSCVYCGEGVEDGAKLTLDHLKVYSKGGSNESTNLVTACLSCNSSRGTQSVRGFCNDSDLERLVRNASKRVLDIVTAATLIAERGSAKRVLIAA